MLLLILLLLADLAWAEPVLTPWPDAPRGGVGTFQQLWVSRVSSDPGSGIASFYSDAKTATGERVRPNDTIDLTCARPDPGELGTCLIVSSGERSIRCRVNDVGPNKITGRVIDLTPAGFRMLGFRPIDGIGRVTIRRCGS